jgi:outer membrane protein OmpA-like peptidoglycan-associated protein
MRGCVTMYAQRIVPIVLACAMALLSGGNIVRAEDQPSEAQILDALKARKPARGTPAAVAGAPAAAPADHGNNERAIIQDLLSKSPRGVTVDDRRRVAEFIRQKPSIDLEVTFEYNSATIGPAAVPTLITLGRALGNAELRGATFVIAGHTDAAGSDSYNQSLSERRAEAVKAFLAQQFKLSPNQLLAIGFGRSHLKNSDNPLAAENRRVQIVNAE